MEMSLDVPTDDESLLFNLTSFLLVEIKFRDRFVSHFLIAIKVTKRCITVVCYNRLQLEYFKILIVIVITHNCNTTFRNFYSNEEVRKKFYPFFKKKSLQESKI